MVADLFEADHQQYGVAYIVLSSVGGTSIGPVIGAFIERYLSWHWNFWTQLIFGGAVQIMHFFLVPETRSTIMMDNLAKKRRKAGETNIWGPNELKENRISPKELGKVWTRPFIMFVSEPIDLCLSLLSGFSDTFVGLCFRRFRSKVFHPRLGIVTNHDIQSTGIEDSITRNNARLGDVNDATIQQY